MVGSQKVSLELPRGQHVTAINGASDASSGYTRSLEIVTDDGSQVHSLLSPVALSMNTHSGLRVHWGWVDQGQEVFGRGRAQPKAAPPSWQGDGRGLED